MIKLKYLASPDRMNFLLQLEHRKPSMGKIPTITTYAHVFSGFHGIQLLLRD